MEPAQHEQEDSRPPFWGKWVYLYLFVIGVLAVLILLFYLFTITYA